MWGRHGPFVWHAPAFDGAPEHQPVYRAAQHYSFSPLALLLLLGDFRLDRRAAGKTRQRSFRYLSGNRTIDQRIRRIGRPLPVGYDVASETEYLDRLVPALIEDVNDIERQNPGYVNVVTVGGKDSLNLLLLPWKNPTIAASGPPNASLVRDFIRDTGLNIDLVELDDNDQSLLDAEVLVNFCRNNLGHCRWTPHLRRLAADLGHKAIFWKGHGGNTYLTRDWTVYGHPRWMNLVLKRCPRLLISGLGASHLAQRYTFWSGYYRRAMWQGAHLAFLRDFTNCLVVSAYHGRRFRSLVSQTDYHRAVQRDIRPEIGRRLLGAPVKYPATNPGPPPSRFRLGIADIGRFLETARRHGLIHDEGRLVA